MVLQLLTMPNEFSHLDNEEQLKAENEFIKMKLMLERGAQFGTIGEGSELSSQIENDFLNYITEFEKQAENPGVTTVYDRLGKPAHFKAITEIPDDRIEQVWIELSGHMEKHGISLDVCSPNISTRELYRFVTEELFQHEMSLVNIPGMMFCFIYDEFHPDHVYDTSRMIEHDLFRDIFSKRNLFYEINYAGDGFTFNGKLYMDRKGYVDIINRFKSVHDAIELHDCHIAQCVVSEAMSEIRGDYKATATAGKETIVFSGDFEVQLCMDKMGYWDFKKIKIHGFDVGE